jgi:hypothetical protein
VYRPKLGFWLAGQSKMVKYNPSLGGYFGQRRPT